MKRKVGGWILFAVGIFFGITCIYIGVSDFMGYGITLKTILEIVVMGIPSGLSLWIGWKLAHPKSQAIRG